MVARPPWDHTGFSLSLLDFIGLTLETAFIDAVFTDGTIFYGYVPAPQGYGVPLFDFDSFVDFHLLIGMI